SLDPGDQGCAAESGVEVLGHACPGEHRLGPEQYVVHFFEDASCIQFGIPPTAPEGNRDRERLLSTTVTRQSQSVKGAPNRRLPPILLLSTAHPFGIRQRRSCFRIPTQPELGRAQGGTVLVGF